MFYQFEGNCVLLVPDTSLLVYGGHPQQVSTCQPLRVELPLNFIAYFLLLFFLFSDQTFLDIFSHCLPIIAKRVECIADDVEGYFVGPSL